MLLSFHFLYDSVSVLFMEFCLVMLTLFGKSHPLLLVSYELETDLLSLDFDN